ncbi:Lrp/AsnC family transcriptional regulator [Pedobacter sp. GR22-6]|uniref:Lrp/AsnC family transcriptional regulator n=1 Tax=Pedobacter sp. GR22-6 TaxID=3127957 RepID=UPI00307FAB52
MDKKTEILDQLDLDILRLLQQDATLSTKSLALTLRKVNTTIISRVSRMKKLGYITGSVTLIDRRKFGEILIAYTQVHVNDHSTQTLTSFQEEVIKFPEVMECYHMTGAFDFLLKIIVNDMVGYNNFLVKKLAGIKNIGALQSYFVINESKRNLSYPLEGLDGALGAQ